MGDGYYRKQTFDRRISQTILKHISQTQKCVRSRNGCAKMNGRIKCGAQRDSSIFRLRMKRKYQIVCFNCSQLVTFSNFSFSMSYEECNETTTTTTFGAEKIEQERETRFTVILYMLCMPLCLFK